MRTQLVLCCIVARQRRLRKETNELTARAEMEGVNVGASSSAAGADRCSIATLAEEYTRLCAEQKLTPLSRPEILPLCESLAVTGLLAISEATAAGPRGGRESGPGRDAMSRSVWLCISDDDLKLATEELHLLKQILQKYAVE